MPREITCPVAECSYSDAPAMVATHISSTHDGAHDWESLPFDGAREFIEAGGSSGSDSGKAGESNSGQPSQATTDGEDRESREDRDSDGEGESATDIDREFLAVAQALSTLLDQRDLSSLDDADDHDLVDLYTLSSELERAAGSLRKQVRDGLVSRVPEDGTLESDCGEVARATRERRTLRDEEAVFAELAAAGVSPQEVMGLDEEKVAEAVESNDLDTGAVFNVERATYVRKAGVNEAALDRLVEKGRDDRASGGE
ncbi:hypothetical protein [Haloarchaeobius amylolyticus]|uniref:hypothetical protein n=1 Tax=Haloarchaeobius amylolyticus TaxID=1198296 RepID=UPI002271B6B3|nr:hypothetical protein [Haloarchaeobius amylolyticus]